MQQRPFGNSGLTTTPIGLGLAALGRPGYINLGHADDLQRDYSLAAMRDHAHAILDAAWQAGIRHFDVARSYGRAEHFLGSWLSARAMQAEDVLVSSKWGYTYTADWQVTLEDDAPHEVKEHSLPVLERQIGESFAQLGRLLDVYQIHSATLDSGVLDNVDVLNRLAQLRAEGIVIGLSTSGPAQAATIWHALDVTVDGLPLFGSVQATWNILERSAEPALAAAQQAGWGVIVKEALANGRLTPRNADPAFAAALALLTDTAAQAGTTVDALALAAVVQRPWASVVLSGAARIDHLLSNLGALAVDWTPDLDARLATLTEQPADYWRIRSRLAWN